MELKEALQTALDFETRGNVIYSEASRKTKNPVVKEIFMYLADQELIHVEAIKGYIDNEEIKFKGDKPTAIKQFFSMTIKEFSKKTELSDDDITAHETGLELEKNAYNFYKEQHDKTDNSELKKFFTFLMEQENAHYELIQKAYEFIKNPTGFYTEEEGWMADGG